jgi:hypothetical protein
VWERLLKASFVCRCSNPPLSMTATRRHATLAVRLVVAVHWSHSDTDSRRLCNPHQTNLACGGLSAQRSALERSVLHLGKECCGRKLR